MPVWLMKALDFWIGIPLCVLWTCLRFCASRRTPGASAPSPPKILFIKLSELGAIILSYPLLRRVRRQRPDASFYFLTFSAHAPVFGLLDGIIPEENILTLRDGSFRDFIVDARAAISRLRRENISVVFDLEFFSRFTALLCFWSGASRRIGFDHPSAGAYRGDLFTDKVLYRTGIHVSKNYLALADPLAAKEADDRDLIFASCRPGAGDVGRIKSTLCEKGVSPGPGDKIILINPGEGILPLREWPLENYISLCRLFLEDPSCYIVVVGARRAGYKSETLVRKLDSPRCVSLVGQTRMEDIVEFFFMADLLISSDSGLVHLASLSPIKKVVLFGPESPDIFGPARASTRILYTSRPCSPCLSVLNSRDSSCRDNQCLQTITPAQVYQIALEELPK